MTYHNRCKEHIEPITPQSKYMIVSAGENVWEQVTVLVLFLIESFINQSE